MNIKYIILFCGFIVAIYVIAVFALFVFQRHIIYVPNKNDVFEQDQDYLLVHQTSDDLILSSFFKAPQANQNTIIVMFHGNTGNISHRDIKMAPLINAGYGVSILGYPGYGGNLGKPSETSFYLAAQSLIDALIEQGYEAKDMILYGESLGSGVASKMASIYNVKGVIFDAPYTSLYAVAHFHYPIFPTYLLTKDRYDTLARINDIQAPVLFMHGARDRVIPPHHSQTLYEAYQGAKKIKIFENGDHANLINYGADRVVLEFIESLP